MVYSVLGLRCDLKGSIGALEGYYNIGALITRKGFRGFRVSFKRDLYGFLQGAPLKGSIGV